MPAVSTQPGHPPAPPFPGATLEIDADAEIMQTWLGSAAPHLGPERSLFAALGIDDNSPSAAQVQMLLASTIGAPAEAWPIFVIDAPATLARRDGQMLAVLWAPVIARGKIARVVVFVVPTAVARTEDEDPAEVNRMCIDALALVEDSQAALLHLTNERRARHCVHRMFRNLHTIKGSTRGSRLQAISALAHDTEALIEILQRTIEPEPHLLMEVSGQLHRLRALIVAARPPDEVDDAMSELLSDCRPALVELQLAITRFLEEDREAAEIARGAIHHLERASERAGMRALHRQCKVAADTVAEIARGEPIATALLDEILLLDRQIELYAAVYREIAASDRGSSLLLTIASWIDAPGGHDESFALLSEAISQFGVPTLLDALADPDPLAVRRARALLADGPAMFEPATPRNETTQRFERAQRELLAAISTLARDIPNAPVGELRTIVERLGWVPLSSLAPRLARMTRTLAAELGKEVTAEIELGDLHAAPELVRVLGEILIHVVRNALDHGIELPGERVVRGKHPQGTIHVDAYALDGRILIAVRDDGRGVALDRVRHIAIERGWMSREAAGGAPDAVLLDLLFQPGFSTASAVTTVSGRGVGMDVIRSLAEERGGNVTFGSTPGRGTELMIDVPLSLGNGTATRTDARAFTLEETGRLDRG